MSEAIDLDTWSRTETYRYFRAYDRPHYAITSRIDATALKASGAHVFRTCLWALGAGLANTPALRLRFVGDRVTRHDGVTLSAPIDTPAGDFRYCYITWQSDLAAFDDHAAREIAATRGKASLDPISDQPDVAFLSCLPWLDYSSLDNALPGPDDCIPRVSWGKIVPRGDGFDMAVTLQVHHALVDGRDVGHFFETAQDAFHQLRE